MLKIAALADSIINGLDVLFTSDDERLQAQERIKQIISESAGKQAAINLQEAKHSSIFVSGWRPALGWLCVTGLGYSIIIRDILQLLFIDAPLPELNIKEIYALLTGLLGFGAFRSFEKSKGVAR